MIFFSLCIYLFNSQEKDKKRKNTNDRTCDIWSNFFLNIFEATVIYTELGQVHSVDPYSIDKETNTCHTSLCATVIVVEIQSMIYLFIYYFQ